MLERAAFGPLLHRARIRWSACVSARSGPILVLGDGDGRHAADLDRELDERQLLLADRSWAMLLAARRRVRRSRCQRLRPRGGGAAPGFPGAVLCDAQRSPFRDGSCAALCTHFVLDQWQTPELDGVVEGLGRAVRSGGVWALADFARPHRGLGRFLALVLLPLLYGFFRAVAGVRASRLEDPAPLLQRCGFRRSEQAVWLGGFLRAEVWHRETGPRQPGG